MEYTKENPLRCFFAFEGYNSQGLALNRLKQNYPDFDWVCVGRSEIDKYAIQAADALFPEAKDKNYGDISKISWRDVPDFDLFTYSFPCTNLSFAGKQEGCEEGSGTASSLLWECRKAIIAKRPKYLLMENVKALVSQKFLPYFLKWQNELASYGYSNFAKVLNSRDFGIPQNRERIFMVSIFDENASYHFPEPFPLDKRLKDVLEEDVDEKYYLSKKIIDTFIERNKINEDKGNGFKFEPTDGDCVASSVLTMPGSRPCDNYIKEPIACAMRGREVQCLTTKRTEYGKKVRKEYESGDLKERRHNIQQLEPRTDGVCNTITSVQKDNLIIEPKILSYTRDANGKVVDRHLKDVANTIHGATGGGGNTDSFVAEPILRIRQATKQGYIEIKPGGIFDASYPDSKTRRGRVQGEGKLCPTLTAQGEPPCYYEGNNEENNKILDNHEQRGIFKGDYQDFTDKILRILRKHLGEEEIQRKIGRLVSILKEEVLRQRMYEESVCDSGVKRSGVQSCTPLCEENKISDRGQAEGVRDMRFKEEYRCSSQGWELSEQFATELNDIMSFLPHEDAQEINEGLHYMRQTYGVSWVLQQALSSLEEIWGSINGERKESYRIRKLSEREVFRLMDVDDANIDKIQAAGISKSQQYKMAGNSICVNVLHHIFRKLFVKRGNESRCRTLF